MPMGQRTRTAQGEMLLTFGNTEEDTETNIILVAILIFQKTEDLKHQVHQAAVLMQLNNLRKESANRIKTPVCYGFCALS